MTPYWHKLGNIYTPASEGRHPKLLTHAANPVAIHMRGNVYRVFYSGRDEKNRSSVGAVDLDILRGDIVKDHPEPFFQHGAPGSFYADGVSIGSFYSTKNARYLLFMGWQTPPDKHWRGDIGRLVIADDLSLHMSDKQPLLSSDDDDPISLSYPWVTPIETGGYHMWYGSTESWDAGNGEMLHVIKHARSVDGDRWSRMGLAVPYEHGVAQAFSRPTVLKSESVGFEMWFSYRSGNGDTYRIGYATSSDGNCWKLNLKAAGIFPSSAGWDSEMIEYPFVFRHLNETYMLYNGNSYGKTGFGLAVMRGR